MAVLTTNTGHKLTIRENTFIDEYVKSGNGQQSVIKAGYTTKAPQQMAHSLLTKSYIKEEIQYRLEEIRKSSIADADEIFQYFTSVMRGEIKDQFGLEASLGERTKAAQELAKRKIDVPNRVANGQQAQVRISIDWGGEAEETLPNDEESV